MFQIFCENAITVKGCSGLDLYPLKVRPNAFSHILHQP